MIDALEAPGDRRGWRSGRAHRRVTGGEGANRTLLSRVDRLTAVLRTGTRASQPFAKTGLLLRQDGRFSVFPRNADAKGIPAIPPEKGQTHLPQFEPERC